MVGKGDQWSVTSSRGLDADGTFQVTPGSWVVTASLEGARPVEKPLEVIEGRLEYEVELVLDFEPATGELQVLVTDERQQEIRTFKVNLWLQDANTSIADFSGLIPGTDGVLTPIPTGYYMVRVTFPAQPGRALAPGRPQRLGDHYSVDTFASVGDGERSTVQLTTHRGGRLRLWIEPETEGHVPLSISLEDVLGGKPRRVGHLSEETPAGQLRGAGPALGGSGFSDLIAPGSYVLRAAAAGYEDFEQTIDVWPGEVTELRIRMRAKD